MTACPHCRSTDSKPFTHHPPGDPKEHAKRIKAGHDHWKECAVTATLCLNCRTIR